MVNHGVIRGEGRITAPVTNAADGEIRTSGGRRLVLAGESCDNAGRIEALGGEMEFTGGVTNEPGSGMIAASDATLRFSGGLANGGAVGLTFGTSHVFGDIDNGPSGLIVLSGGGRATFYDDLANDGEVRISDGSVAVFFGGVSGGGSFTGTGTSYIEGDLRPGHSPGRLSFQGTAILGRYARTHIELAGGGPGEYDAITVGGPVTLGGALELDLLDGYEPDYGRVFRVIQAGELRGRFDRIEGVRVGPAKSLAVTFDGREVTVTVALPGDGDLDGQVDAADYVLFKRHEGLEAATWSQGDFNGDGQVDWLDFPALRDSFGSSTAPAAVPEPATLALLLAGGTAGLLRRRRRRRKGTAD